MSNFVLSILLMVFFGVVVVPLLSIWSMNALFGLGIEYSFKTWAAAALITGLLSGNFRSGASKK